MKPLVWPGGYAWRVTATDFLQDIRYAVPVLTRSLGYSLVVISVCSRSGSAPSLAVLAVVSAASLVPAWRASRIDPITALRQS